MDPELFRAVGEALYGARWKSEIATLLEVDYRTVQRWAKGEFTIPWGVKVELRRICLERGGALLLLAVQLQDKPSGSAIVATTGGL
jgi:hypothetical protein